MRYAFALLLSLALIPGCKGAASNPLAESEGATPDGPCAPEFRQALARIEASGTPPDDLARISLKGISESCQGLSTSVTRGLDATVNVNPADSATIAFAILDEDKAFAQLACPDFKSMQGEIAKAPAQDRLGIFLKGCQLARLNLANEAEFTSAWKGEAFAAGVLIGPSLYVWLVQHGMKTAEARKLVRTTMGLR